MLKKYAEKPAPGTCAPEGSCFLTKEERGEVDGFAREEPPMQVGEAFVVFPASLEQELEEVVHLPHEGALEASRDLALDYHGSQASLGPVVVGLYPLVVQVSEHLPRVLVAPLQDAGQYRVLHAFLLDHLYQLHELALGVRLGGPLIVGGLPATRPRLP